MAGARSPAPEPRSESGEASSPVYQTDSTTGRSCLRRERARSGIGQTIGQVFGGKVVRCHEIVHGKMGTISHNNKGIFSGLPSPFQATRYHSLVVDRETLPASLEVTAELEDGTIMGLQHRELPLHGVQFHPESIRSEHGHAMLQNFLNEMKVPA